MQSAIRAMEFEASKLSAPLNARNLARRRRESQLKMERDIFGQGYGLLRQKARCGFVELFEPMIGNHADFPVRMCLWTNC
jgi:hypothetical protein